MIRSHCYDHASTQTICFRLLFVALEHVLPEGFYLLNVSALAVYWHSGEQETFCEFALEANLLIERTHYLVGLVVA